MADNKDLIGKKVEPIPLTPEEVGIDTDEQFIDALLNGIESESVDINTLDSFSQISQSRENIYTIIDAMSADDRISAVLETIVEDCVETNDKGQVLWCESNDERVSRYVGYLLDILNVDKNAYEWMYCLLRYGDVYLRTYRESDYKAENDFLFNEIKNKRQNNTLNENMTASDLLKEIHEEEEEDENSENGETLNEDVKVSIHQPNDKYIHYVEMVPNPGEMFELTKFGKTRGYISAPVNIQEIYDYTTQLTNSYLTYKLKQKDVVIYGPTDFVHASLRNTNNIRTPEEVRIFKDEKDFESGNNAGVYNVRRGQSILYNKFRIWRQLCLTENSILLDRVTKSALIRLISVETAGMPKNKIRDYIHRFKEKVEQKVALSTENGTISNYTNPGPLLNTVIVPTRENQGSVSIQTVGGDYDPKQLTDLDHLETRFYGSFRVPKAYFNLTDDGAGFNGGKSLAIISSRYGKAIKQYQNIFCQMITDLINLFLIDAGYNNYINRFTIRMQAPVTEEEMDRRDNLRNRMGIINDIMNQSSNLELEPIDKLKLYKEFLAGSVNDPAVISIIQDRINEIEKEIAEKKESEKSKETSEEETTRAPRREENPLGDFEASIGFGEEEESTEAPEVPEETPAEEGEESWLPGPNDLGIDMTGNI